METNGQCGAVRLRVTNERTVEVAFHLEPWGEVHAMLPGAIVEIEVSGVGNEAIEIVESDASITFWGTTGSSVRVWRDGVEIGADNGNRPGVPNALPLAQTATRRD